jgi:hypothetical protein
MKKANFFGAVVLQSLICGAAYGGSMACHTSIISDDETDPPTRDHVVGKCGHPARVSGGDLFYETDGTSYRLHFNDDGKL